MQKYTDVVQNRLGLAVEGAKVLVTDISGSAATIFSNNGTTQQANPMTTNANGRFSFYAADGRYNLTVTINNVQYGEQRDILLNDPADPSPEKIDGGVIVNSQVNESEINNCTITGGTAQQVTVTGSTISQSALEDVTIDGLPPMTVGGHEHHELVEDVQQLTAQSREALRRSYADAGYNLVDGSFEEGGVLTSTDDVMITASGYGYSWAGTYPVGGYSVAPNTDPTVAGSGYVPRSDVALRRVVTLTFPTIADIDESQLSVGATVVVENYSTACKSGMLLFKVAALGTGAHDGGKYINLTSYQLVQNLRKPFNVMAWGACGNSNGTSGNGADDRNAIYNCYKYAASSSARSAVVFFPRPDGNNCYRIGSGFEVNESDYTYFVGEGGHYTASKILVDFNGIAIYRNTGQFCNSFRNLVFQSANPVGYTAAAAIYSVGTVESTLEEVSFLDFWGIACNLNACFGVRVIHPLVAGNYSVGLKLSGGNGNILDTPIFQDNLGTAVIVEGAAWTIINPYWENNCKRNDPATENGGYYNMYVNASQTTIIGGTLNQYPQDKKVPIHVASADVTIINMNVYSLAATDVVHIESSSASLSLIACAWSKHVSGYTANLFTSVTPLAGYRKADVTLSGRSVSDNLSSAWCNFNGTLASPISPRQGSNVSNITKLGTGTYRVNFQNTMATNSYMVNTSAGGSNISVYVSYGTKDAGFVDIYVRGAAGTLTDVSDISVEVKEIKPV